VIAVVDTAGGCFAVDLDSHDVEPWEEGLPSADEPVLNLPRVVAARTSGSTVVALVDAKPPLLVSYDSGTTWREAGRGLPAGRAVAIGEDPDVVVYASRNRLFLSRNGGVFWTSLPVELPEIRRLHVAG
jgi:hypothetical protein